MVAIVAVDARWGIGRDNGLLFHISDDLKRFRALTEGKTVLMGRKTLQSLPGGKGLPRRRNVVLTGDKDFQAENAEIVHSAAEAVWVAGEDAWVIGGESVYRQMLPYCDRVYVLQDGKNVVSGVPAEIITPELIHRLYDIDAALFTHRGELYLEYRS